MRNYGKISPFFWLKGSGKRLRGDALAQVVAAYLSTSPATNMVGIFFLSLATIASETGHPLDDVRAALGRIARAGYAAYDFDAELVWIPNHAYFEIGEAMKVADKRRGKVLAELAQVDGHRFVDEFRQLYGAAYHISANDVGGSSPPPDPARMPLPEVAEGASAIQGQGNHRTGQSQDRDRGIGASVDAPPPEAPPDSRFVFTVGTPSYEAIERFEQAVTETTGRAFALGTARYHPPDICTAINTHGPPELRAGPDLVRWMAVSVSTWIRQSSPKKITPGAWNEWLNAGKPSGVRPKVDTRQPLIGEEPKWLADAKAGKTGTGAF